MDRREQRIHFTGALITEINNTFKVSVNVVLDQLDATNIAIDLLNLEGRNHELKAELRLIFDRNKTIYIKNDHLSGAYLEIFGLNGFQCDADGAVSINAHSISYGLHKAKLACGEKVQVVGYFTPSGLLEKNISRVMHYDGTVEPIISEYENSYWKSDLGKFLISSHFGYIDDEVFNRKVTTSYEATCASIEVEVHNKDELDSLHEKIVDNFNIISVTLSLFNRTEVSLYIVSNRFL